MPTKRKSAKHYGIRIDADHDSNGNPRDGVALYAPDGTWMDFVDRGYRSVWQSLEEEGYTNVVLLDEIPTTVKFYKLNRDGAD